MVASGNLKFSELYIDKSRITRERIEKIEILEISTLAKGRVILKL